VRGDDNMKMTPVCNLTLLSIIAKLKETTKDEILKEYKENYRGQLDKELKTLKSCYAISISDEGIIKHIGSPRPTIEV
jgi:hypothetical protein